MPRLLQVILALAMAVAIWTVLMAVIRSLANPPPEIDPDDVVETRRRFRCSLCGTQVTMTVTNMAEPRAPRHCREEMDEVPVD